MRNLILFIFISFHFSLSGQVFFKKVDYTKRDNSYLYSLLNINNKNSIIVKFYGFSYNPNPTVFHYLVLSNKEFIAYTMITDEEHLKILERGELKVNEKKYTKIFENKKIRKEIKKLYKKIKQKKYLQLINQTDLDIDYSKEGLKKMLEQGDAYYSDCGSSFIEFYQGEKYYKLQVDCSNNRMGRNQEKLDLFNELYKLLNDTWNIQNGVQDRFIENKENQE